MDGSYIEGRFGIVMEEIKDALWAINENLEKVNVNLDEINKTRVSASTHWFETWKKYMETKAGKK
jgi:type II secretory pathway component PulC